MTDYPNKPLAPWIPKSMRNSGQDLDEMCDGGGNASATDAMDMDPAFDPLYADKKEK
jgi:hypothetical protein